MGWVWGNALRCWIKWHIFWNVAKQHAISFKDETEETQGIIQPETALVKVRNGMKWRLKKWKVKDEKRQAFSRMWFLKKQAGPLSQEHLLKGLILQEHYLWGHKCTLTRSKKYSDPFRTETWDHCYLPQISTALTEGCGSYAHIYIDWESSYSSQFQGILFSTGFTPRLFCGGEYKRFWNCHFSKWEILQYFYSGGTWTISVGNQFYNINFFSTWYLRSVMQN